MTQRYETPLPWFWFTQRRGYRRFMGREITSFFLGGYLVFLLIWLRRLGQGPEAYAAMIETTRHPVSVVLHMMALAGALYHSITWFNLTPKAMPQYLGEHHLPNVWTAIVMGYAPWLALSGLIMWGMLR